jgi:hypothetical protein
MSDLYADQTTVLRLSGPGVSPYSARGLNQTLEPIAQSEALWRTINGSFIDVSAPQFRKYHSVISCSDQNAPAFDGVWPGQLLTVDCVVTLSYKTDGGSPARPVVPDSSYQEGAYTIYRPRLQMRVRNYQTTEDEWGAVVSWSLDLEEV